MNPRHGQKPLREGRVFWSLCAWGLLRRNAGYEGSGGFVNVAYARVVAAVTLVTGSKMDVLRPVVTTSVSRTLPPTYNSHDAMTSSTCFWISLCSHRHFGSHCHCAQEGFRGSNRTPASAAEIAFDCQPGSDIFVFRCKDPPMCISEPSPGPGSFLSSLSVQGRANCAGLAAGWYTFPSLSLGYFSGFLRGVCWRAPYGSISEIARRGLGF